jgi:DUF1680 family protein
VNLFIGNETNVKIDGKDVKINMSTEYPWDGIVDFTVESDKSLKKELRIRVPEWCENYTLSINGEDCEAVVEKGYAVIPKWKSGDKISFVMDMPVRIVSADPRVKQDVGKRTVMRGPLVYCLEEVDNPSLMDNAEISNSTSFTATKVADLLGGVVKIEAKDGDDSLTFVPYYAWDNREAGKMKVWVDYEE